jgi:hypothetical protein
LFKQVTARESIRLDLYKTDPDLASTGLAIFRTVRKKLFLPTRNAIHQHLEEFGGLIDKLPHGFGKLIAIQYQTGGIGCGFKGEKPW